MKILMVVEYVRRFPWSGGRWAADLSLALRRRGHALTVACDGVEDAGLFGPTPVLVRRPKRTFRGSDPSGFQAWALDLARTGGFDATVSLTPLVPADLWMPVSYSSIALVGHLVRSHSLISAAMELAARPWLPAGVMTEARSRGSWLPGRRVVRTHIGSLSGEAPVGYASRLEPMGEAGRARARAAVRDLLGLSPERPLLLASVVHPYRPGLDAFMRGLALTRHELRERGPVLLFMGRRTYPAHRAALASGCGRYVRFLGGTARPELALAACDVAVAPFSGAGEIATGRFIADALRLSVPVLAHPRAPGAELVRPEHFGTPEIGEIVADASAVGWSRAIQGSLSLERWPYAKRAARDAGEVLSMGGMAARVEHALTRSIGG